MQKIIETFEHAFRNWKFKLPEQHVVDRQGGRIISDGWSIWYQFGRDGRGEYLDYYASHRMTDDMHLRLREDGSREPLETLPCWRERSPDPVKDAALQRDHEAEVGRISELLRTKGFWISGDEPMGVQINWFLRSDTNDSQDKQ